MSDSHVRYLPKDLVLWLRKTPYRRKDEKGYVTSTKTLGLYRARINPVSVGLELFIDLVQNDCVYFVNTGSY